MAAAGIPKSVDIINTESVDVVLNANTGIQIHVKIKKIFGVCKDKKCNFIDQQMCRNFWNSGFCIRDDCGFIYPTKIGQRAPVDNIGYRL